MIAKRGLFGGGGLLGGGGAGGAGGTTAPVKTHPVLANLWQLILKYGPTIIMWLISSGIIKLPPGVTLPPGLFGGTTAPAPGSPAPAALAHLDIMVEYDAAAAADILATLAELHADVLA